MSSAFNLPVRKIGDSSDHQNSSHAIADPSRFSILGEPLPESATHELGPPLGLTVAAVIAMASMKANEQQQQSSSSNQEFGTPNRNYSENKAPFQLPLRKVNASGRNEGGVDVTKNWAVIA